MGPTAALLSDGQRLHLQHGPIDLIIGVDGDRSTAFAAAKTRFETVLPEIVAELNLLRAQSPAVATQGEIPRKMQLAARLFDQDAFITAMAAVAGSVAETVLQAMVKEATIKRAFVNNGGDIALYLTPGQRFKMAMAAYDGGTLGHINVDYESPVRGIATSGRHGRSHSLGIADSVTVLAKTAAVADVAATLIANAVDLPGHRQIQRVPATDWDENSDLGSQKIITGCGILSKAETTAAISNGMSRAQQFQVAGHVIGAGLFLNGQARTTDATLITALEGTLEHA